MPDVSAEEWEARSELLQQVSAHLYSVSTALSDSHATAVAMNVNHLAYPLADVADAIRGIHFLQSKLRAAGVPVALPPLPIVKEET